MVFPLALLLLILYDIWAVRRVSKACLHLLHHVNTGIRTPGLRGKGLTLIGV